MKTKRSFFQKLERTKLIIREYRGCETLLYYDSLPRNSLQQHADPNPMVEGDILTD